ncbi:HNH endonuclease [Haemophilus haemolyticus]|uniref:HNH endonuclease n=1 Tax=Haemophilus haemolyticus TaxID=726 RepID=UPI000E5702CD|nr:HNH endonuclease [Haemophilus haemolyticus]
MIRLTLPDSIPPHSEVINLCCERDVNYKQHVLNNQNFLINKGNDYERYSRTNDLYTFDNILPVSTHITGSLENEHMVKLYEYCLRDCRGGDVYNTIINLAKSPTIRCPFCGGIGIPTQLDHFLPKSRYGHFSVLPYNLVPICKDCNTEYKKEFFPISKYEQLIHPYLDDDCFFNQQWLYAKYEDDTVTYFVVPPDTWSYDKKEKVHFHFQTFNLAERFAENAVGSLSDLLNQIQASKAYGMDKDMFESSIIESVIQNESRVNSWKRVLFLAIKDRLSDIWLAH